jgi:hypothetical protein
VLTRQIQPDATGDEDGEAGTRGEELADQRGRGQQMLEVVEDEKERFSLERRGEPLRQGPARVVANAERLGQRIGHTDGIAEGGEGHERHSTRQESGSLMRQLEGETGLADASGPGQG